MTEQEKESILQEEKEWQEDKIFFEKQKKVFEEKKNFFKQKKISTSNLLILFMFLNCTAIEIFTGWVTIQSIALVSTTMMMPDFSPLVTLIGAVVSEVIGFAIYSIKATKENTKGGIVYDTAMKEYEMEEDANG